MVIKPRALGIMYHRLAFDFNMEPRMTLNLNSETDYQPHCEVLEAEPRAS